jgi:hypothetical protein
MTACDLCLAWNWEYDAGFTRLLRAACERRGVSLLEATPESVGGMVDALGRGELRFTALLDRASDSDPRFDPLVAWARQAAILRFNPRERARWAWDKATMHLEFISRGLHTPHTLILPPHGEQPELPALDLSILGGPFVIKPAMGGGGVGVVLEATSLEQVARLRQEYPQEKVLLQSHVEPLRLDGRPAWFRVLYCLGAVYPHWWDTGTHVYGHVTAVEGMRFGLGGLKQVMRRIAQICGLDLFSTEIALVPGGDLLVVDTVNDPVDLRLQAEAVDGVPDPVVANIAARLAARVAA